MNTVSTFVSTTCLLALTILVACDGQSASATVGVSAGGATVSAGGSMGAGSLEYKMWNDLEAEKDFWNDVLQNPGPWAEKYDVTNGQVAGYAQSQLDNVWDLKESMIGSGDEDDTV